MAIVTPNAVDYQLQLLEKKVYGKVDVPEQWERFVAGTVIRSGAEMAQYVPYKYQRALDYILSRVQNVTVAKTRQIGVSQQYASKFLHEACKNKAFTGLVFLPTQDDVSGISKRVGEMLANNKWDAEALTDNIKHIQVNNGGSIYFRGTGGKSAARGTDSVSAVAIDEIAFAQQAEAIMGAALASTALAGDAAKIISVSTPDVSSGLFYDLLQQGTTRDIEEICDLVRHHKLYTFDIPGFFHEISPDGRSAVVVIHHTAHPVYGEMGRMAFLNKRQSIEKVPWGTILREYDLTFNVVGSALLNPQRVRDAAVLPALNRSPVRDKAYTYYAGIDASTGGADYCVLIILRRHRRSGKTKVVSVYRERYLDSHVYLVNIKTLLQIWQPEYCCVETNGAGKVFFDQLSAELSVTELIGFNSSAKSKLQLFAQLSYEFDAGLLDIWHNHPMTTELLSLKDYGNGDIRCPNGKDRHDDLAFGLGFAVNAYYEVHRDEKQI